jgi:hypothetical protein
VLQTVPPPSIIEVKVKRLTIILNRTLRIHSAREHIMDSHCIAYMYLNTSRRDTCKYPPVTEAGIGVFDNKKPGTSYVPGTIGQGKEGHEIEDVPDMRLEDLKKGLKGSIGTRMRGMPREEARRWFASRHAMLHVVYRATARIKYSIMIVVRFWRDERRRKTEGQLG